MLFLDEVDALSKIREIFGKADQAKIAVAFWGRGAVQALGIDRPDFQVEVICNLDSGACNPSEVRKLVKLCPHFPARSDPRLHGKLYWTPTGIVVGSSNASTNGLAVEDGLSGWAEANVFSDNPKLIEETLRWFEARKTHSYVITDVHLRLAERIWKDRVRAAAPGISLAGDLGAAFRKARNNPVWKTVKLAIYSEDLSAAGKKRIKADRASDPALAAFEAYEDWHKAIEADDWLLDFWLQKKKAKFGGYWRVPNPKLENELLTYIQEMPSVTLPGFGMLELSKADLSALEDAALAIARSKGASDPPCAMVPLHEAIAFIDDRESAYPTSKDIKAFERAMRDIFIEAARIGYRPTEFLKMIDREGALATAKRLIMSNTPSSGFTRLWELNRSDLTVEALALREPWRRLFTEVELQRARRRLRDYGFAEN